MALSVATKVDVCVGVLSLPYAWAQLGWIQGFVMITVLGLGAVYSGHLLSKLHAVVPTSRSMADLGEAAMGLAGRRMVVAVAYVYMAGVSVRIDFI